MCNGVYGLPTVTFLTVIGVPVAIIVLLAIWGATFDARFRGIDGAKDNGGEGA